MNLNTSNLSHPRTAWSVEAAMWRAIEESRECSMGVGITAVDSTSGKLLFSVIHDRHDTPGFSFWRKGVDVTAQVIKALREQGKALEGGK
jgi:hypothetical protein